ncbi:2-oxoacid dehydrogenases acyltransferase-domain-containing protein [Hygrophoropsis aurantiaca]|uniref:2-oxoacid dehydrogenases acyltransferase-domain-containing protein n=1 Tax=Hygrophoropsis aurantiaca TaxID=72124 RepID=A0ACB8A587_9AGAM|nr:2-oxoacid dehydrogenases acyltransferase-domain-containing protein [Hygrophoropsis aurantiaca]
MLARPLRRLLGRPTIVSHFHTSHTYWASRKVLQKFKLADIGEGITECEVIKWSIKENSSVQSFDPLCEVQSDKASVEITSPFDGVVKELLVKEGEVAKVGQGLCLIEVEEETPEDASEAQVGQTSESTSSDLGDSSVKQVASDFVSREEISKAPAASRRLHPLDPNYTPDVAMTNSQNALATPSVRHFAKQRGVDLSKLAPGSGRDGRIEKKDIEAFLSGNATVPESTSTAAASTDTATEAIVELGRTRYGMWKAMVKSLEIPHFGYSTTLDITSLHDILPVLNAHIPSHYSGAAPLASLVNSSALYPAPSPPTVPTSGQYTRLTYLPILLKTLSRAMMEWPILRSSITPDSTANGGKPTLTIRPHTDISVALSTPTGLYTPTIQRANSHSVYSLSSQLKHLSYLGRQTPSALTPAEMPKRGGTLTVSNIGAIGAGESAAPVLVPGGGVAIVAIGRAKWEWDVNRGDGKGERRLKLPVSWSADHRVLEGAELAAFVECWRTYVEAPQRLIGDAI